PGDPRFRFSWLERGRGGGVGGVVAGAGGGPWLAPARAAGMVAAVVGATAQRLGGAQAERGPPAVLAGAAADPAHRLLGGDGAGASDRRAAAADRPSHGAGPEPVGRGVGAAV